MFSVVEEPPVSFTDPTYFPTILGLWHLLPGFSCIVALPGYAFLNRSFSGTCTWTFYKCHHIMCSVLFCFFHWTLYLYDPCSWLYVIIFPPVYCCVVEFCYMNLQQAIYLVMNFWFISSFWLLWGFKYLVHFFWSPCAWASSRYRSRSRITCHRIYVSSTLSDKGQIVSQSRSHNLHPTSRGERPLLGVFTNMW